ncbi:MAG: DUF502 domain-containing protein [Elusimicrobiota bacterium]
MNKLKRQFFSGLVIFVPLSLTIYFIWMFFLLVSQGLTPSLTHQKWVPLPTAAIRPLSFVLTFFLIWLLGVVATNFIGKRIMGWVEAGIRFLPFFRGFYEAIQKVTEAFFGVNSIYQSAVLVEYPRKGVYTFGFVTSQMPGTAYGSEEIHYCIFIPTVPNPTSGILLYVPKSQVIPLDISIENVVKILVSHGFMPIPENAFKKV